MSMTYSYDVLRATFPAEPTTGGNFSKRDLPTFESRKLVASTRGKPVAIVSFEATMSPSRDASTVYGFIWVRRFYDDSRHPAKAPKGDYHPVSFTHAGAGKAGGYGYHKTSAAFADALANAGIVIEGRKKGARTWHQVTASGGGDSCIDDALYTIGESLGFKRDRLAVV